LHITGRNAIMSVDERRREALLGALAETLGPEHAETMSRMLPPAGGDVAIQQGMDARFDQVDRRFDRMDQRFDGMDQRFDGIDQRLDVMDHRFDGIDQRLDVMDHRFDGIDQRFVGVEHQLEVTGERIVAAFRGELVTAVAGQTRTLIVASTGAVVGLGGLAAVFAQLL
jgi:archaellum component FlaC